MPKVIRKPDLPTPIDRVPAAFSVTAAAAFLGVSRKTIFRLIRDGKVKAKGLNKNFTLIDGDALRAFYNGLPDKVTS